MVVKGPKKVPNLFQGSKQIPKSAYCSPQLKVHEFLVFVSNFDCSLQERAQTATTWKSNSLH